MRILLNLANKQRMRATRAAGRERGGGGHKECCVVSLVLRDARDAVQRAGAEFLKKVLNSQNVYE